MKNIITNNLLKMLLGIFAFFTMGTSAFAHSNMEHASISHSFIHLMMTATLVLAVAAVAYYLYRLVPKSKRIRIKK